ncbi:Mrp/NBP35 family ATP-binding protein [Candidatus Endowatersipora endosymbiont of Watersipora subatra]|uniref:Mrp/NBP35 family ATP-binding protein n=1 Tax=Candidatus Endowatersipora endosymbiont of Watersipora subatra TaxID=3077946 RepID=UPI00312CB11F
MASQKQVLDQLKKIKVPYFDSDIVSLGLVNGIHIEGDKVIVSIAVPAQRAEELEELRVVAQSFLMEIEGVNSALAVLTEERKTDPFTPLLPSKPAMRRAEIEKKRISGIDSIIAVASGKGGVGKSTISVNLALGLKKTGLRVGILDADIHGPSLPHLLGITQKPTAEGRILNPILSHGLTVMSIGFLIQEEKPIIWRAPMVTSALKQMLSEVAWGKLDVLVVDMPPGTGDVQLTMAQQVSLEGAIIVSTPQDIALIDALKSLNMFKKVKIPILGIVENMSSFICPKCGEPSEIFGQGGARAASERLGVAFLGEVPLHIDIRTYSDAGNPVVESKPNGVHAQCYVNIARKIAEHLNDSTAEKVKTTFE